MFAIKILRAMYLRYISNIFIFIKAQLTGLLRNSHRIYISPILSKANCEVPQGNPKIFDVYTYTAVLNII